MCWFCLLLFGLFRMSTCCLVELFCLLDVVVVAGLPSDCWVGFLLALLLLLISGLWCAGLG